MNSLQDYSVVNLLPESLKKDPFIVALGEAVEKELKEAYREAESLSNFYDVDKLPEPLLDYLAYQKHVDFYEPDLPIEQKRKLVENTTAWHRKKGTRWAVENVVSVVYKNAQVYEWFEYGGEKYRFKIEVDEPFIANKDMKRLRELVESTKNKRSLLEYVAVKIPQKQYIELKSLNYSYPVYLPICGEIYCDGVPGINQRTEMGLQPENYYYPVYLPICGEVYLSEVNIEW